MFWSCHLLMDMVYLLLGTLKIWQFVIFDEKNAKLFILKIQVWDLRHFKGLFLYGQVVPKVGLHKSVAIFCFFFKEGITEFRNIQKPCIKQGCVWKKMVNNSNIWCNLYKNCFWGLTFDSPCGIHNLSRDIYTHTYIILPYIGNHVFLAVESSP